MYDILGTSRLRSAGRTSVGRHEKVSSRERALYGESNKLKNAPKSVIFRYENVSFLYEFFDLVRVLTRWNIVAGKRVRLPAARFQAAYL